jgi:hypothetical protein
MEIRLSSSGSSACYLPIVVPSLGELDVFAFAAPATNGCLVLAQHMKHPDLIACRRSCLDAVLLISLTRLLERLH